MIRKRYIAIKVGFAVLILPSLCKIVFLVSFSESLQINVNQKILSGYQFEGMFDVNIILYLNLLKEYNGDGNKFSTYALKTERIF